MDAKTIIELSKSLEQLKKKEVLKKEVDDLNLEKARLQKNIKILQRANVEEQANYDKDKTTRGKEISQLQTNIKILEVRRSNLATSAVPEIKKLENLRSELDKKGNSLHSQEVSLTAKNDKIIKDANKIEDKKEVLLQIAELFKKI